MHVIFLDNVVRTLSWTFIHSLWQGLIMTIAAGLIMLITKRSVASLRYALLCTLFFLFIAGVVLTFFIEWTAGPGSSSGLKLMTNRAGIDAIFHYSILRQPVEKLGLFLDSNSQWIVLAWLIILGIKSGRMILNLIYVSRLRNHKICAPDDEWKIKLQSLGYEMGIRKKVSLLQSALVSIPIVVGHLKPAILVPIGALTGLPAADVEAVLLHELAHIRRHDYLVNFIQRIAEMLLFFNPALLWISSLIRIERENCCDDIAIEKIKDKSRFVKALISFKEHSLRHPQYAIGLFGKRNLLLQRVSRIVHNRNKTLSPFERVFFVMNLFILMVLMSVIRKPESSQPSSLLPLYSNVEPALNFSTQPNPEILRVAEKKLMYTNKNVNSSSSGNTLAKHTEKNKEPVLSDGNFDTPKEKFEETHQSSLLNYQHDQLSKLRADINLSQAEKDRQQAEEDRKQADKDRIQADKDRQQADKDRQQADKDREQANIDRKQADKDRERADQDRKQADKDSQEAEKARTQTIKI